MRKSLIALVVLTSLILLPACASIQPGSAPTEKERVLVATDFLDTSLASVSASILAAKQKYPEKTKDIEANVDPVLENLQTAVAAYKSATSSGSDNPKAWAPARALVTTAISVAAPYVIAALI